MELKHGAMLWIIIALISYATFFNKFKIAFVSAKDATSIHGARMPISDDEIIQAIEKRIKEKQALNKEKNEDIVAATETNESNKSVENNTNEE